MFRNKEVENGLSIFFLGKLQISLNVESKFAFYWTKVVEMNVITFLMTTFK